jgi:hypothetical protein
MQQPFILEESMIKKSRKKIVAPTFFILGCLLFSAKLVAQDTVDQVVDRYLKATGGREKISGIRTQVAKGEFSMPDMGMYAPIELYIEKPNKLLMMIDIVEVGGVSNGVNGDTAWEINPMTGPRILEGGEKSAALRNAQIDPLLNWEENFINAEISGEETIGDENCVKAVFTPSVGEPWELFFSKETGLIVKSISNDGQYMEATFGDYRDVDGVIFPFLIQMVGPQFSFEMKFESIEVNVDIPPKTFEIPPEIKSLLN